MAQAEQELQRKHEIAVFTLIALSLSLISGCIGMLMYHSSLFSYIEVPMFLQSLYQFVCTIPQIIAALPFSVSIFENIFEVWSTSEYPEKYRRAILFIKVLIIVTSIIIPTIVGYSVAKESSQSKILSPEYKNSSLTIDSNKYTKGDELPSEAVLYLENILFVDIQYVPIEAPPDINVYRIFDIEKKQQSPLDRIFNPFSTIVHAINQIEYIKFEITLEYVSDPPQPESSPVSPSGPSLQPSSSLDSKEVPTGSTAPPSPASSPVLVIIKEILVKKDGVPLIKANSTDPQVISYGSNVGQLEETYLIPTSDGYPITFQQNDKRYVQWNGQLKYVDESNMVYFEDNYIDSNIPFMLTLANLKALLGERLSTITDNNLKISIKEIGTSKEAQVVSPPLEMSTRENAILYHLQYGKNDFYFAINSLAGNQKLIDKDINMDNYKLLCELMFE